MTGLPAKFVAACVLVQDTFDLLRANKKTVNPPRKYFAVGFRTPVSGFRRSEGRFSE